MCIRVILIEAHFLCVAMCINWGMYSYGVSTIIVTLSTVVELVLYVASGATLMMGM